MSTTFKIDMGKIANNLEKTRMSAINFCLDILDESIIDKSPVDTGIYIAGNKKEKAIKDGDKIVGKVYNDTEYAEKVEFGWKKSSVNWHKGGAIIYNGVGARVYTRTFDEKQREVKKILQNNIKIG